MAKGKKMVTKKEARSMASALRDRGIKSIDDLADSDSKKLSRWLKIPHTVAKRLIRSARQEEPALLDIDLTALPGVGQARKEAFEEAGIASVGDLAKRKVPELEKLLGMDVAEIEAMIGTARKVHALVGRIQGKKPTNGKSHPRSKPASVDKLPVDKLPVDKLPVDKLPVDKLPVDKLPVDKLPVDKLPVDKLPVDKLPVGKQLVTADALPLDEICEELSQRLVNEEDGALVRDISSAMSEAFEQSADFRRKLIARLMADPEIRAQVIGRVIKNMM